MACIVFAILFISLLVRLGGSGRRPHAAVTVTWGESIASSLTPEECRAALDSFFTATGAVRIKTGKADCYRRGDHAMVRFPQSEIAWHNLPVFIGLGCIAAPSGADVGIHYRSGNGLSMTEEEAALFKRCAVIEFSAARKHLEKLADRRSQQREQNRAEDRPNSRGDAPPAPHADLATLGLKVGAGWPDIQTAYRELCRKLHPDHLTGQNVAPHLIELAVQRFKEVSAAYQRLKAQMARARSCA